MVEEDFVSEIVGNLPKGFQLQYELNSYSREAPLDGRAQLVTPDGAVFTFAIEIKKVHRKETLMALREQIKRSHIDVPALLLCNRLTPAEVEYCVANQLNFIDTAGNARVHLPGFHFIVEGKNGKMRDVPSKRISEGTLKLLLVLLSKPEVLNENYRTLAALSGISLGMVSKAFDFLEVQHFYRKTKNGRRLMNIEDLQALWMREYVTTIRPKLKSIPLIAPNAWQDIPLVQGEYWGGEVAAAKLSEGYLIPENWLLFTPYSLPQRRTELGLKPMREGKLQLASAFWGKDFQLNREAEAMLCVAELLASKDGRNLEVARIINDKYLNLKESSLFGY